MAKHEKISEKNTGADSDSNQPHFAMERVYLKNASFETKETPQIFRQEWKPKLKLDISTNSKSLDNDLYDVNIRLTVTVESNGQTAFVVEVDQAGLFSIKGFAEEQLQHTLGAFCPSLLYPYAREAITNVVAKGSFPQLLLAPVNFDALYRKQVETKQANKNQETTTQ